MQEEIDHNGPEGFAVDTTALDRYIGQIVNPALDNFINIATLLSAMTGPTQTMLGHEHLPGSTEFTGTCRVMLNTFFNAHNLLAEKQRALVHAVTTFRDNLARSTATYLQNEADRAQSVGQLSRQLETRLQSDGSTG